MANHNDVKQSRQGASTKNNNSKNNKNDTNMANTSSRLASPINKNNNDNQRRRSSSRKKNEVKPLLKMVPSSTIRETKASKLYPKKNKNPVKKAPSRLKFRKMRQQAAQVREKQGPRVVAKATKEDPGTYYELERILDKRKVKGRVEYLVKWVGFDLKDATWEPSSNLCTSAYQDAILLSKELGNQKKKMEETEKMLGLVAPKNLHKKSLVEDVSMAPGMEDTEATNNGNMETQLEKTQEPAAAAAAATIPTEEVTMDVEETRPYNNNMQFADKFHDEDLLQYQQVQRIHVYDDPNAREKVTSARINGIPICLVGHKGWAQFATRWLNEIKTQEQKDEPLDLSKPHTVSVRKMIADIGFESVPVLKKNYDESKPITQEVSARSFLQYCWPSDEMLPVPNPNDKNASSLYLHQWQFPRSDTASAKLCGQSQPLPNDIFDEDLLNHWLDHSDNPFQYIFMGREDTLSKLHADNGGLEITIAPIVGEKECVLVHRDDGDSCFYKLDASLDRIDLHKYPLMQFARIWKTVIVPGEILVMPYGTFHQCRNVTSCMSYSRFHLDTINLRPFLESMFIGDAPEINHDQVIWNCTTELLHRVDKYVMKVRKEESANPTVRPLQIPSAMGQTVKTLRMLRQVCREIDLRSQQDDATQFATEDIQSRAWRRLVEDVDMTLHEYQYRHVDEVPKFLARKWTCRQRNNNNKNNNNDTDVTMSPPQATGKVIPNIQSLAAPLADCPTSLVSTMRNDDIISALEEIIIELPSLQPFETGLVIPDSQQLKVGDSVAIRFHNRRVRAKIIEIHDQMKAVLVHYDGLSETYNEYHPLDAIQEEEDENKEKAIVEAKVGESTAQSTNHSLSNNNEEESRTVYCRLGGQGKMRRAAIKSSRNATFYKLNVLLENCKHECWVGRDSIMTKIIS